MLQACVNGGHAPGAHPALPATAAEIAADLAACYAAGAAEAHFHPRSADMRESLAAADMAETCRAARLLGRPFGVSSQAMIPSEIGLAAEIAAWAERPDYASVNLHERGAAEIRRALEAQGVGVEAGVWSVEDVARLADGPAPMRILIEIMEEAPERALAEADAVLKALDQVDGATPRLLHGQGGSAWPLLRRAQSLGLDQRIGFEDVMLGEDGGSVGSNAELVAQAAGGG